VIEVLFIVLKVPEMSHLNEGLRLLAAVFVGGVYADGWVRQTAVPAHGGAPGAEWRVLFRLELALSVFERKFDFVNLLSEL